MKCIIFSRVSTTRQDLVEQTTAIIKKAEYLGYSKESQIVIEYKESGIKLSIDEREGIAKLKDTIESDPAIDCLIVWELSRLARRADIIFAMRDFLVNHKIRFVVMKPEMEILGKGGIITPTTNLLLGIYSAFIEDEMLIKRERFARGKEALKSKGLFAGGKVLMGYTVKDKHYVIDPILGPIVRYIYEEYANAERSGYSIAKELYEKGAFGLISLKLAIRKVKHILEKREYTGDKRYPALVSEELWNKAAAIRKKRTRAERHAPSHCYYCQGIIFATDTSLALTPEWGDGLYRTHNKPITSISVNIIDSLAFTLGHRHLLRYGSTSKNSAIADMKKAMITINRKKNVAHRRYNEYMEQVHKIERRYILGKLTEGEADTLEAEAQAEAKHQLQLKTKYETELQECIDKLNKYKEDAASITFNEIMDDKTKYQIVHEAFKKIEIERTSKYFSYAIFTYDDLHTEKYKIHSRTHKVFDDNETIVDYEYVARVNRTRK